MTKTTTCAKRRSPHQQVLLPKKVTVGTDFSGMDTPVIALKKLKVDFRHVFSCEKSRAGEKLIKKVFQPEVFYKDIEKRSFGEAPACSVYVSSFPSPPFSNLSTSGEGADDRGRLVFNSLKYVESRLPPAVIFENVPQFATKHAALNDVIRKAFRNLGYVIEEKVLDAHDHGLPHSRPRWYFVAIATSAMRKRGHLESVFPAPRASCAHLPQSIVAPAAKFLKLPTTTEAKTNAMDAYEKAIKKGINPFVQPLIIDCKTTPQWPSYGVGSAPCLRSCHCRQANAYWCSTKGGFLEVEDLAWLQGVEPADCDWKSAKISKGQFGGLVGNAMSVNILVQLLPRLLHQARLVTPREFKKMEAIACSLYGPAAAVEQPPLTDQAQP